MWLQSTVYKRGDKEMLCSSLLHYLIITMTSLETDRILIVGAGAAGLITAHSFIQDGFRHVDIVTRDPTPGGIWSSVRVYPGLIINK